MSDPRIEEIRERWSKASPTTEHHGLWVRSHVGNTPERGDELGYIEILGRSVDQPVFWTAEMGSFTEIRGRKEDFECLSHAPEDIRYLLERIERQRTTLDRVEARLDSRQPELARQIINEAIRGAAQQEEESG